MNINISKLVDACDKVEARCTRIAGTYHGSAWLFDKLMRFFESNIAAESVTFDVYLNIPIMSEGEAVISRNGELILRRK